VLRVGTSCPSKLSLKVERGREEIFPTESMLHAHHWLILHGRYTRLARISCEAWRVFLPLARKDGLGKISLLGK
jgi:endonuclease III